MTVTDRELFSILDEADRLAFANLCAHIGEGNAIAFIGAGLSARLGFCDWKQLVDMLQKKVVVNRRPDSPPVVVADTTDLIWRAELVRNLLEASQYQSVLKRYFGRRTGRDVAVDAVSRIPFRHVFTTNYDESLERALARSRKGEPEIINWSDRTHVNNFMGCFAKDARAKRYLVYLHGKHDDPSSIVLTESDYRDRYARSDETTRRLFAVFAMRTVVFLGFSLTDLDLLTILREVRATHDAPGHYAILPLPEKENAHDARSRFQVKYGVTPIFYRPGKGKGKDRYPNFAPLMQALSERTTERNKRPGSSPQPKWVRWTQTDDFKTLRGKADPEDPQKGRFGREASRDGLTLQATAERDREEPGWYFLKLEVADPTRRLRGIVGFWVHDSFSSEYYAVRVHRGRATLSLRSWGAFTVGAVANQGRTPLELDLSQDRSLPRGFRTA